MPSPEFLLQIAAKHGQAEAVRLIWELLPKDSRFSQYPWEPKVPGGVRFDQIPQKWRIYEDGIIHSALEGSDPLGFFKVFFEYGMKPDHNLDRAINTTARAIGMNDVNLVKFFLSQGAKPTGHYLSPDDTYLGAAARRPQSEMLKLLLGSGSEVKGSQALRQAVERGQIRNADILLDVGVNVNEVFTKRDQLAGQDNIWGCPLHFAISSSRSEAPDRQASKAETVRFLLSRGAKPEVRNGQGKTALQLAVEENEDEVVRILNDCDAKE